MNGRWILVLAIVAFAAPGPKTRPPTPRPASATVPTAGLAWRNIGPFRAGRVAAVAGAIGQPGVFYIGLPFGGVWKTTSAGTTWFPVFDDVKEIASIGSIVVAPSDPNVIYVGTGDTYRASYRGNGIYKSTDAGNTWQHVSFGPAGSKDPAYDIAAYARTKVPAILVDPKDPNIVVAAALGNGDGKAGARGVFRSADGGATWTRTLFVDDQTGVEDIAAAFDRPDVMFAVAGGVYKSTDEGRTWTTVAGTGLPPLAGSARGLRRLAVADHTNAQRVFLAGIGRLLRSDDGGATWKTVTDDPRPAAERVYVSPNDPDLLYGCHITVYRSKNGGGTWEAFKGAPGGDDPHVMWIDPTDPNRILLAGDQGASVSLDGGRTWGSWYNQSTAQIYHIGIDSSWPYWVYGQQQDSGAVAVKDRGDLGEIGPLDWYPTPGWESGYIVADPANPKILYANGPDSASQLVRISVPTGQWIHVGPNLDPAQHLGTPGPLVWNPFDQRELMVGYSRVMSTTDGGRDWAALSPDFATGRGSILALSASHAAKGLIWAGLSRGGVRVTRDHGAAWTDASIPNVSGSVVSIDASHKKAGEAFAAVTTGDNLPHIYRTGDYGKTWAEVVSGLPADEPSGSFVNVVRTDTERDGLVFAGTERSVYVSFDDGDQWQPLRLNLPTTSVRDIAIHENDLVVATFGRGIWVLDDYSPLRQMTDAIQQEPAHLFRPGAGVRVRRDINGDTPFPPEIPHFKNPPLGVVIYYSLTKAPASPLTLDVLDAAGHVVRHMSSAPVPPIADVVREFPNWWLAPNTPLPATIGLNRVNWDVRYDDPPSAGEHITIRAVPGDTPMHYQGPLALPGTYTVRLTVDGKTFTQPVLVVNDPRSTATPADLLAQHQLQMRLYEGITAADAAAKAASAAARPSFDRLRETMNHLLEELDSADFAPTPSMIGAYAAACGELRSAAAKSGTGSVALPDCQIATSR